MRPGGEPDLRCRRLCRRADFLRVSAARGRWATPAFVLQAAPMPSEAGGDAETGELRVGFTVSRRVGGAVDRNRIRRRLRAAAAAVLPAKGRRGMDYVIIARREALTCPYPALVAYLETALGRVSRGRSERAAP